MEIETIKNNSGVKWEMVKLGDLIDVLSGYAFDSKCFNESIGIPLIRIRDIKRSYSDTFYNGEFDDRFIITHGDILIGMDGEFNVAEWKGDRALLNQRVCKVSVSDNSKLLLRYLLYFLPFQLKLIEDKASFVTVKHLSVNDIKNIQIPLPPLPVQKRIAEILDAADALRRKDQELLKKYDELAQAIFIDMFGDPVKNEKGREVKKLIDVAKSRDDIKCGPFGTQLNRGEYQTEGIPIWGIPQINSNFIKTPTEYVTQKKAMELKEYSVEEEDIIMSRKGNVGACSLFPKHLKSGVLHSDAIRIRVNKNMILPKVLLWQFKKSRVLQTQVANVSSGAIMAGINVTNLKQISVYVPCMNAQNKFASELQKVENLKEKLLITISNSDSLFQTLLQKAFKGELVAE